MRFLLTSAVCLCAWALTAPATAQTFTTIINIPPDVAPSSIGSDTQLNLSEGGSIGDSFLAGASDGSSINVEVNITGGIAGEVFTANSGSTINISGGTIGTFFEANPGSLVNISGGRVDAFAFTYSGSTVNISGGVLGPLFGVGSGSVLNVSGGRQEGLIRISGIANISGGSFGSDFIVRTGGLVNISGGSVGNDFNAFPDSTVNLFGTAFFLDGLELTDLVIGEAFTILERNVTLEGLLADGSAFSFDLNSVDDYSSDFFDPNATLTVTLVPEPGTLALLGAGGLCVLHRRMN